MKRRKKRGFFLNPMIMVDIILVLLLILGVLVSAKILSKGKTGTSQTASAADTETQQTTEPAVLEDTTAADTQTDAVESIAPEEAVVEKTEATMLFGGDLYLDEDWQNQYDGNNGIEGITSSGLREVLSSADFTMVNLDAVYASAGSEASGKSDLNRIAPDKISILNELGINMVNTANTHALDYGMDALNESNAALAAASITTVGSGTNLTEANTVKQVVIGGHKVGFIGVACALPKSDWTASADQGGILASGSIDAIANQIQQSDAENDLIVAYMNWGNDGSSAATADQTTLAHQLIDAGADLVIGSHAHVAQGIEYYNEKPIIYGLGNFLYGNSTYEAMMLKATIAVDDSMTLSVVPIKSAAFTCWVMDSPESIFSTISQASTGYYVNTDGSIAAGENPYAVAAQPVAPASTDNESAASSEDSASDSSSSESSDDSSENDSSSDSSSSGSSNYIDDPDYDNATGKWKDEL